MRITASIKKFLFMTCRLKKYAWLSDCRKVINRPKCHHPLLLRGNGTVVFGDNVQIGVYSSPNFFSHYSYMEARNSESQISIGNGTSINNAFSAIAYSSIEIGNNVLIGVNCSIIDSDGHDLSPDKRHNENVDSRPVRVSDNVFIGSSVTILKGVTIGENSVIGNGAIVTRDIPANVIAAGNPAKVIQKL